MIFKSYSLYFLWNDYRFEAINSIKMPHSADNVEGDDDG